MLRKVICDKVILEDKEVKEDPEEIGFMKMVIVIPITDLVMMLIDAWGMDVNGIIDNRPQTSMFHG